LPAAADVHAEAEALPVAAGEDGEEDEEDEEEDADVLVDGDDDGDEDGDEDGEDDGDVLPDGEPDGDVEGEADDDADLLGCGDDLVGSAVAAGDVPAVGVRDGVRMDRDGVR
jgi:hypothetical protein